MTDGRNRFGLALVIGSLLPANLLAQDTDGGQLLTFGVSQRLSYESNPDLTPGGGESGAVAVTGLSFSYSDQARVQGLSLTANTGLRAGDIDGPTIVTPVLGASFSRNSADAVISLNASASRTEINRLTTLDDFTLEDGTIELPPDFENLNTTLDGTQTRVSVGTSFTGGRTRPLGYTLSASVGRVLYDGAGASTLDDSQTLRLGGGLNLKLDDVTTASIGLDYTRFDDDDDDVTDQLGLNANWRKDRPLGPLELSLSLQDIGEDPRLGFNAVRTVNRSRLALTFGAGVSLDDGGEPTLTGRVNAAYPLPTGSLSFAAQRTVATTPDAGNVQITSLSAGISQTVTPLSRIGASLNYLSSDDFDTTARSADLSASYSYQLSPDWALTTGAQYQTRTETGFDRADNESVFMSLGRSFTYRP